MPTTSSFWAAFPAADAGRSFEVVTAVVDDAGPWAPGAVGRWLDNQPEPLLRAKGWFAGPDGGWHELQVVGRRWSIQPAAPRAEGGNGPGIVLIGQEQSAVDRAAASLRNLA